MAKINGNEILFGANVNITREAGTEVEIVQTTGESATAVMSQKASTDKFYSTRGIKSTGSVNDFNQNGFYQLYPDVTDTPTSEYSYMLVNRVSEYAITKYLFTPTGKLYIGIYSEKAAKMTTPWTHINGEVADGEVTRAKLSDNYQTTQTKYITTGDLNDYKTPDLIFGITAANVINKPDNSTRFYVQVDRYVWDATRFITMQTYTNADLSKTWRRYYDNAENAWTQWMKLGVDIEVVQTTGTSTTAVMSQKAASDIFYKNNKVATGVSAHSLNNNGFYMLQADVTDTPASGVEISYMLVNYISEYAITKYLFTVSGKLYVGIYSEKAAKMTTPWTIINGDNYKKKIVMMGDSIFAVAGYQVFDENLAEELGSTVYNCAFGGTRFSDRGGTDTYRYFDFPKLVDAIILKNFTEQENNLTGKPNYYPTNLETLKTLDLSTIDILVLNFGTNDFAGNVPLSNETNETDTATLKGAMRYCIDKLLTAYPNLKIAINCPYYRFWVDSSNNYAFLEDCSTRTNTLGHKLVDYVQAEKEIANEFLLNCYDNLNNFGWNKYNRGVYFPASDGVHFNTTGVKYAATALGANLKNGGYLV